MNFTAPRQPEKDRINVESAVSERYTAASKQAEAALCCAVQYEPQYLEVLPQELIEKDYGCGNPAEFVGEGECVLDLGSGGGKICYIASQIVGPRGRVFGVDINDDMLALARAHQGEIGERIGWHNVQFFKGKIQDLALDLERFERHLREHPVATAQDWSATLDWSEHLRRTDPMIPSESIDVVVSNCVLNLVRPEHRAQLFAELHRVVRRGGRVVISDIVSDEPVPEHLKQDPTLWSGCISGAFEESEFLAAFEQAGFYGIEILKRQSEPWTTVEGIEFRSVTVRAFKGKDGPCLDYHQAVIYTGPWKAVTDDDGHVLQRGQRTAVCAKNFQIYSREPYASCITPIPPYQTVGHHEAAAFDCHQGAIRPPRVTKGADYRGTQLPTSSCCGEEGECG